MVRRQAICPMSSRSRTCSDSHRRMTGQDSGSQSQMMIKSGIKTSWRYSDTMVRMLDSRSGAIVRVHIKMVPLCPLSGRLLPATRLLPGSLLRVLMARDSSTVAAPLVARPSSISNPFISSSLLFHFALYSPLCSHTNSRYIEVLMHSYSISSRS